MHVIKCYDVVEMVIDDAGFTFKPAYEMDERKRSILQEYCEALDEIGEEFNVTSFDASVNDDKTICVCMYCPHITIEQRRHRFYDLIVRAIRVNFSTDINNDNVIAKFVFPSIWRKVGGVDE